jgi:hypothetical protein
MLVARVIVCAMGPEGVVSPTLSPPSSELQLDFVVIGLVIGYVAVRIWRAKPVLPIEIPGVEHTLEFLFCAFPSFAFSWGSVMLGFIALDLRSHVGISLLRASLVVFFVISAFSALAAFLSGLAVMSVRKPRLLVPPHLRTVRSQEPGRPPVLSEIPQEPERPEL